MYNYQPGILFEHAAPEFMNFGSAPFSSGRKGRWEGNIFIPPETSSPPVLGPLENPTVPYTPPPIDPVTGQPVPGNGAGGVDPQPGGPSSLTFAPGPDGEITAGDLIAGIGTIAGLGFGGGIPGMVASGVTSALGSYVDGSTPAEAAQAGVVGTIPGARLAQGIFDMVVDEKPEEEPEEVTPYAVQGVTSSPLAAPQTPEMAALAEEVGAELAEYAQGGFGFLDEGNINGLTGTNTADMLAGGGASDGQGGAYAHTDSLDPSSFTAAMQNAMGLSYVYGVGDNENTGGGFNATDDGSGSGGPGGDWVVCTFFAKRGEIPWAEYSRAAKFSLTLPDNILLGYYSWAFYVLNLIRSGNHPLIEKIMLWIAYHRTMEINHRLKPGRYKSNWRGKLVRWTIEPLCYAIGMFRTGDWREECRQKREENNLQLAV